MNRTFSSLHARTLSHATEDLEKVKTALLNTIGPAEVTVGKAEGHHGNPIEILEAKVEDEAGIVGFFNRLSREDLETLKHTLSNRVDEGCNLFVKIDKQAAYSGTIRLGAGDDVISIRIKIRAFPAKMEHALSMADEFIGHLVA